MDEGIFLLILGGVKGFVEPHKTYFLANLRQNLSKEYDGVLTFFVILSAQE